MKYVDGFLLPVTRKDLPAYRRLSRAVGKIWREHGALEYRECVGDDLAAPVCLPFTKGVRLKRGETVVFSWIGFKSRAHRDRVNEKVLNDPRIATMTDPKKKMPFDVTRMMYGGFAILVDL